MFASGAPPGGTRTCDGSRTATEDAAVTRVACPVAPIFSGEIFGRQRYGGVSRYVLELHRALRMEGAPSLILAPLHVSRLLGRAEGILGVGLPARTRLPGVQRLCRLVNRGLEPTLLAAVSRRREDIVLHASYYDLPRAHEAYPFVVTVHDMIHERHEARERSPEVAAKLRACARADLIVAVSEHTRAELIDLAGISPERVRVCHHGTTVLKPAEGTLRTLARSRPFVLYVGKRNGYKNFARLLEAYAASATARAGVGLIAFGGGPALSDEVAHVASLGVGDLVSFRQGGDADLAAYYRTAQLFVYPSLDEGFGLPVLEAMAHSCPVVAGGAGAIPEVAADAAHLFDPTDVEAIGAALDNVFLDSELRLQLVARGEHRSAEFTWARTARQMLEMYAQASANHRGARAPGGVA